MAKLGEVLIVRVPQSPKTEIIEGRQRKIPQPPKTELIPRAGWNGLSGRRISQQEVDSLAEVALRNHLRPTQVASLVERRAQDENGKRRTIRKYTATLKLLSHRIEDSEHNATKRIAREEFRSAKAQELQARRDAEKAPNSFLQLTYARAHLRPVRSLKLYGERLSADRLPKETIPGLQGILKQVIKANYPDFQSSGTKGIRKGLRIWKSINAVAKLIDKVAETRLAAGITGIVSMVPLLGGSIGTFLSAVNALVERGEGKRPRFWLGANAEIGAVDFFGILPFYGTSNMKDARGRTENVIHRGHITMTMQALTNPESPYYKHRKELAEGILNTFPNMDQITLANVSSPDATPLPVKDVHFYLFDHQLAPLSGLLPKDGARLAAMKKRMQNNWQRQIATLVDTARAVKAEQNVAQQ